MNEHINTIIIWFNVHNGVPALYKRLAFHPLGINKSPVSVEKLPAVPAITTIPPETTGNREISSTATTMDPTTVTDETTPMTRTDETTSTTTDRMDPVVVEVVSSVLVVEVVSSVTAVG
jgi:hypothetical protein